MSAPKECRSTTSIQEKIIKPKPGLLELAKQLGSVSPALQGDGYSRDSFYRLKELYEQGGEEALIDLSGKKPVLKNRVPEHVEKAAVDPAVENPAPGRKRASWELQQKGMMVSSSGARSTAGRCCMSRASCLSGTVHPSTFVQTMALRQWP